MEPHPTRREDDLNDCERRLAAWQPAAGNLNADTMLFAAGCAAGRRGRVQLVWPALCALLVVLAAALGVWGRSERAERMALAALHERAPSPNAPQTPVVAKVPEPRYAPAPDDYFHLRRRLEEAPSRWLAVAPGVGAQAITRPPPGPSILRAGQHDGLLPQ